MIEFFLSLFLLMASSDADSTTGNESNARVHIVDIG
jgi:hypothetical protein